MHREKNIESKEKLDQFRWNSSRTEMETGKGLVREVSSEKNQQGGRKIFAGRTREGESGGRSWACRENYATASLRRKGENGIGKKKSLSS